MVAGGDPERRIRKERIKHGIDLNPKVWEDLKNLSEEINVEFFE